MGEETWSAASTGELLRSTRLRAGLSQEELARRVGVPRTMVSAYERELRQATLPTLRRLLLSAGFDLQVRIVPVGDAEVLEQLEEQFTTAEEQGWQAARRRAEAAKRAERRGRAHGG